MILCSSPSEQFKSYQSEIENAVISVMRGNSYVLGEQVKKIEREFAEYIGVSSAIGVANGTDAIEIALRALNIGFGDEVITVSHTAVATVAAIEATGASAVLVDVDPKFYTLNPNQLQESLTNKTKAIITALCTSVVAGVAKEVYDDYRGGIFDKRDILATGMGGVFISFTIPLFQNKKRRSK